jgi:hypothetical protein
MELGNFTKEDQFANQELQVDQILLECTFYASSVPKTFKKAQKSTEWNNWKAAINKELKNLEGMGVWSIKVVPAGRKPLKGQWVFAEK